MSCVARIVLIGLACSCMLGAGVHAGDEPQVVLGGLSHPSGLAIQPQSDVLFIAESGAGRVVRVVDGELQEVAVGFDTVGAAPASSDSFNAICLHFLTPQTLAVGVAGSAADAACLFILRVPAPGEAAVSVDAAVALPIADAKVAAPVRLRSVISNGGLLFAAVEGPDGQGWLARAAVTNPAEPQRADSYGPFERLSAPPDAGVREMQRALAVAPRGEIVVAQTRHPDAAAAEGLLAFYRATDGKRLLQLPIGLTQVDALAYGARRTNAAAPFLYALENAPAASGGGLYRLDAALAKGQAQIRSSRIAALQRPTALTLATDGALYVTVAETDQPAASPPAGRLLRFPPGL